MRTLSELLDEYSQNHQHPTNKRIHWICVPAIVFSVIGLLISIPFPGGGLWLNFGTLTLLAALLYYARLSPAMALGMAGFALLCLIGVHIIVRSGLSLFGSCLLVFVLAWLGQFYGHKLEGRKPSFFKDVQFLLIGPAWCIAFLYRKFNVPY